MQIWRVEHRCSYPHGPLQPCPDFGSWLDNPNYGACLEPPQSIESGLSHINLDNFKHYIFGTLPEQFDRWWSRVERDNLREKWWAVLYDVPPEAVVIGKNQVMFDSYAAVEVFKTQSEYPR